MAAFALHDISKRYGTVPALDGVSLTLRPGQIHGILGENGAGKSTLLNILFGAVQPDRGRIERDGRPLRLTSPRLAIAAGIGLVHQHFHLVDSFTVRENVLLGERTPDRPRLDRLAARLGLWEVLDVAVGGLPVGVRQRVEILKALYRQATLLLLDEPTAVLTPPEVETLFDLLRELRAAGAGVVFITHKLREALELCDTITVLRQGRVVAEYPASQVTADVLAAAMVGEHLASAALGHSATAPPAETVRLRVENLTVPADGSRTALHRISFEVREGEIFGIAGVDGNGQTELAEALVGLRPMQGNLWLDGRPLPAGRRARLAAGLRYIPPDRRQAGLALELSVAENVILGDELAPDWRRWGVLLDRAALRQYAGTLIRDFDIRTPHADAPAGALSGGNQQKLLVARELAPQPRVLVAVNPTWGVDVASVATIHRALRGACRQGLGLVLMSNELDEIQALCQRFAVLYRGRLSTSLTFDIPPADLGRLMAGDGPTWERYGRRD
ncbi:ABC transporter ATP-binding protein [Chloracidobacterium aggregatum]|uniref:ABC transporter ATP-binding protein n=1 Tax=Chloracidobacterium sp. N TaxID=2821540 RepID=A0ABX8AYC1_9BACT|nr:ABC transporter ATP-binding protein [Chloracidobacterium aggregatum]QUV84263.1 ABC transporter ATP-binding protein [Chloracidobacterium sp. 2]QUV87247.1 ABC transporter ATP-binding protein [Chloracidobacterium sp. S]QUV90153.1 ABC transporter ATP-binding protein [Chloracidobacterium sp. A]QUV93365.1 ABC transporter ATP-binding protein [Chloracidobacterium sp. N]QUV96521.1 ABC transporter ATP-binding protein [Chloracidobacterium sp. E]